jgi:hypothetical protein
MTPAPLRSSAGLHHPVRRFSLSARTTRALLIAYATAVFLLSWYPWNILLLALVAAWDSQDKKGQIDSR